MGYGYATLPENILAALQRFRATMRENLTGRLPLLEAYTFTDCPTEGFKQRINKDGVETAKVWLLPVDNPNGKGKSHHWVDNSDFIIIRDFLLSTLGAVCDAHKVPTLRTRCIALNYYPPKSDADPLNPVFPYHTDFGYINSLISDGPTMILDPADGKWKEIELGNRMMLQVGGAMQAIKPEYKAIPHGVGKAPVIADGLGKISIGCFMDPTGPMVLTKDHRQLNAAPTITLDAAEYIRLRFKATHESDKLTEAEQAVYNNYLAQLDDFPRPTAENLA